MITHRTIKADASVDHYVIFIGETENVKHEIENHKKEECFKREIANCLCVYWEDHVNTRNKIAEDLKKFYHPPCNDF